MLSRLLQLVFLLVLGHFSAHARSENRKEYELGSVGKGAVVGSYYNTYNYVVETVGRRSNLVIVRDKSFVSSLGNYKSWVRLDAPHGNVNYHHLNINPAVTGVPDPHTWIPKPIATAASGIGKTMEYANKVAPVLFAASVAYDSKQVYDTYQKDPKEGVIQAATTASRYAMSFKGCSIGASVGTAIMPGVGTLVGSVVGSIGGATVSTVFEPFIRAVFN